MQPRKKWKKQWQPGCKPGYVGFPVSISSEWSDPERPSRHLSMRPVARRAKAAYPPAMDGQSLDAGILGLAARQTCGASPRDEARWALTPPFHPCRTGLGPCGGCFLSRLLRGRPRLSVRKDDALRCPDFPHLPSPRGRNPRRDVRLPCFVGAKLQNLPLTCAISLPFFPLLADFA